MFDVIVQGLANRGQFALAEEIFDRADELGMDPTNGAASMATAALSYATDDRRKMPVVYDGDAAAPGTFYSRTSLFALGRRAAAVAVSSETLGTMHKKKAALLLPMLLNAELVDLADRLVARLPPDTMHAGLSLVHGPGNKLCVVYARYQKCVYGAQCRYRHDA
eukprot:TRINITY_DN3111_c0_g1_i1.p3 TRINITY_DN3111_c0_g1~~TRINITY_DN3111_c0_g1_i1.p3  ORF type:complete len:164 (+),score=72.81 TRINITY_DN3111_c0_g1_i1:247-738(+)